MESSIGLASGSRRYTRQRLAMQQDSPRSPRAHPLAYVALACSSILCCPVTSITGALIGWIALRSIDASAGQLAGRRIAIWAILIGLVMLPVQFFALQGVQSLNESMLRGGIQRAVGIIFEVDGDDRAKVLQHAFVATGSRRPTVEEADAFVAQVTRQFGSFRSVSIAQSVPGNSDVFRPAYQLALVFSFEQGTATGGAECVLVPTGGSFKEALHIRLLEIDIGEGTVLQLPPGNEPMEPVEVETSE